MFRTSSSPVGIAPKTFFPFFLLLAGCLLNNSSLATITVVSRPNNQSICGGTVNTSFTTLSNIQLAESSANEFTNSDKLRIAAPLGWIFDTSNPPVLAPATVCSLEVMQSNSFLIRIFNPSNGASLETLTVSNLRIQPTTNPNFQSPGTLVVDSSSSPNLVPIPNDLGVVGIISPVVPSVTIAVSPGNSLCQGQSATFTATPINGGGTPSFQWKVNGTNAGTNSATFTTAGLNNGDNVTCIMTSNASCVSPASATSSAITVTVSNNLTPSVTIAVSPGNTLCRNQSATFTATPINGGSTPSFQWKVNGTNAGTNSATFTTAGLNNGDNVTCVMTSNASCVSPASATSSAITVTVSNNLTPSVTIGVNPGNTICQGQSATFTATPINGGSTPSFQWKVNGINAGANSATFTTAGLNNGDNVTCVMTSSASCVSPTSATSSPIQVIVRSLIPPTLTESDLSGLSNNDRISCSGDAVTLSQTGLTNFQWFNGSTTSSITINPTQSQTFSVTGTDANGCTSTGTISITVNNLPNISVTSTDNSGFPNDNRFCASGQITLSATPNIATDTYSWTGATGTGAQIVFSSTNPGPVSVVGTRTDNSTGCINSDTLLIQVDSLPNQPLILTDSSGLTGDSRICLGDTFTIRAISGNSSYSWLPNSFFINPTPSGPGPHTAIGQTLGSRQFSVTITSIRGCVATVSTSVNVVSVPTVSITSQDNTGNATDAITCVNSFVTLAASPNQTINTYEWNSPLGTIQGPQLTFPASTPGTFTFTVTLQDTNGCDATANKTVQVNALPSPSISAPGTVFCQNSPNVTLTATAGFSTYQWSTTSTNASISLSLSSAGDTSIAVTVVDLNDCSGTDSISLHIIPQPSINPVSASGLCDGEFRSPITFNLANVESPRVDWTITNVTLLSGVGGSSGSDSSSPFQFPSFTAVNTSNTESTSVVSVTPTNQFSGQSCPGNPVSFQIIVNPSPELTSSRRDTLCSGDALNYLLTSSISSRMTYRWHPILPLDSITGPSLDTSETSDIITDDITSLTFSRSVSCRYALDLIYTSASVIAKRCITKDTLSVLVNPRPPHPSVTNLVNGSVPDQLCAGTELQNFDIDNNPGQGVTYQWSVETLPVNGLASIFQSSSSHALVSFYDRSDSTYLAIVSVVVTSSVQNGLCVNTPTNDTIVVLPNADSLVEKRIIRKNPGGLLVYLDNTVDSYQWGADDTLTLKPRVFPGQIYQVCTEDSFPEPDSLLSSYVWVEVEKGGCRSKVYYNGPNKRVTREVPSYESITLRALPNPSQGQLEIEIDGDLWNECPWTITSAVGSIVASGQFNKVEGKHSFPLDLRGWAAGTYLFRVVSDKGVHTTRFILQP